MLTKFIINDKIWSIFVESIRLQRALTIKHRNNTHKMSYKAISRYGFIPHLVWNRRHTLAEGARGKPARGAEGDGDVEDRLSVQPVMATYLCYLLVGGEEQIIAVADRDVDRAIRQAPAAAYCFYFYEGEEGHDRGMARDARVRMELSNSFYLDATLLDYGQVELLSGDYSTALSNMRNNKWRLMILSRGGGLTPYQDDRHVLIPPSED